MEKRLGPRLWAVLLTGVPFGFFKFATGLYLYDHIHPVLGAVMMAWGGIDILINLVALAYPRATAYCLLADIGRALDKRQGQPWWEDVMLAIDTLVTLLILAGMIWFGGLAELSPKILRVWEVAVVANIVSAGIQRVWQTIHVRRTAEQTVIPETN